MGDEEGEPKKVSLLLCAALDDRKGAKGIAPCRPNPRCILTYSEYLSHVDGAVTMTEKTTVRIL